MEPLQTEPPNCQMSCSGFGGDLPASPWGQTLTDHSQVARSHHAEVAEPGVHRHRPTPAAAAEAHNVALLPTRERLHGCEPGAGGGRVPEWERAG